MPLAPNSTLGPYEIKSTLGSGGMGEVFRARDSRLNRDVAIKVMHESGSGAERTARFEREARTVAALNHPNIVAVFDFGSAAGVQYAVSELVEGETLRALIQSGPVPTRKLVDIAAQMADGLAAAHAAGIVHRDLKPENVMLTRDGRVKILDFGLARQDDGLKSSARASANTAATIENITHAGQILGTASYMSPEQATGRAVDCRTDQFSFGLILYELASGKQAFAKESTVETLAAIVREEPSDLEVKLPLPLRWTIDRCLAKEPGQRYESTRDLYHDLKALRDHLSEAYSSTEILPVAGTAAASVRRWKLPVVLACAAIAILLAGLIGYLARPSGQDLRNYKFTPFAFNTGTGRPVWSPDGKAVAYSGRAEGVNQVFVRNLNASVPVQLTHMNVPVSPVGWAADGAHVIVVTITGTVEPDKLYSISSLGGDPEFLMDVTASYNGTVSRDGGSLAVFRYDEKEGSYGVWLSSPIGAPLKMYSPAPFASKDIYDNPVLAFSPDGKKVLLIRLGYGGEQAWLLPLPAGRAAPRRVLTKLPDHLLTPSFSWMPDNRHVVVDAAKNLWLADTESDALTPITAGTVGEGTPAVSPDGKRIVFTQSARSMDIVSVSLTDGSIKPLISTGAEESMAAWARNAERLVFVSNRNGLAEIWVRDGVGAERPVITAQDFPQGGAKWFFSPALSPDGNRMIYGMFSGVGSAHMWMSADHGGAPVRLTNVDDETGLAGSWSPDGSRFAFLSLKNNELKLMMVRTTGAASPVLIKNVANVADDDYSGMIPEWSPDGRRLTYHDNKGWHLISMEGKDDKLLGDFKSDSLVFSKDGQSLYGIAVDAAADKQSLFRYDLQTAKLTTIKELDRSQRPVGPLNPGIRFSLAPDGTRFVYSTGESKSELWMLEGWQQPTWWERLKGR